MSHFKDMHSFLVGRYRILYTDIGCLEIRQLIQRPLHERLEVTIRVMSRGKNQPSDNIF